MFQEEKLEQERESIENVREYGVITDHLYGMKQEDMDRNSQNKTKPKKTKAKRLSSRLLIQ